MQKIIEKIGFLILIVAMLSFASFLTLEIASLDKVIYGVKINDQNIGGFKKSDLEVFVKDAIKNYGKITIKSENLKLSASLNELGIKADIDKTIDSLFSIGRERNIFMGMKHQMASLLFGRTASINLAINNETFDKYISENTAKLNTPAENANFSYEKDAVIVKPEKLGKVVDKKILLSSIITSVSSLKKTPVQISFKIDNPKISKKLLEEQKEKVENILKNAPYIISQDDSQKWEIDKSQIKDWLIPKISNNKVALSFDKTKIKNFLIQISPSINREPQDAVLTMKDGRATEFQLSKNGIELDVTSSALKIESEILKGNKKIILKVNETLPEIRTDTIENLGITSLLGKGESDFSGSIPSRIHNIKLGAEKLNGLLIKPGEEFSFVKSIGDINAKEGYKPAYVIKNGATIPEYGGGLCQVSTTTFRAAMWAGLKITERFPHSYPVSYYDPQGFDAAIYGPHPDLRFVNDTPNYMLIQSKIVGNKLYFEIYGTSDGRKVKIIGPEEYDKKPDGSLKAHLTREIYDKDGKLITKKTYYSNYKSQKLYPVKKNPLE